jgi:hypothetical protein
MHVSRGHPSLVLDTQQGLLDLGQANEDARVLDGEVVASGIPSAPPAKIESQLDVTVDPEGNPGRRPIGAQGADTDSPALRLGSNGRVGANRPMKHIGDLISEAPCFIEE